MEVNKVHAFTIFTPTYNRAHTLGRVFQSIRQQTFRDFEWIVIDGGSEDNTSELVRGWMEESDFPIIYCQHNSGKHVAINRGVARARGFLFVIVDSDDWLHPDALERMLRCWESIPDGQKENFVGVGGLFAYFNGEIVGDPFPSTVFDSDMLERWAKWNIYGDKMECFRVDVLRRYPFPEDIGRFVPEGLIWNELSLSYETRFFNEVVAYKEYLPGGLSSKKIRFAIENARSAWVYFKRLCTIFEKKNLPFKFRLKSYVSYTRFGLHAHIYPKEMIANTPSKFLWILTAPLGIAVYLLDNGRVLWEKM
ncbi:MAG: glycosyltransferase family 2 protein [Methanothrix sp.]|uniref:glycosyltransferase family 2 protein n=1 Tax=Methanothrix sp. TaxID=90426 RepID=UPI003BB16E97